MGREWFKSNFIDFSEDESHSHDTLIQQPQPAPVAQMPVAVSSLSDLGAPPSVQAGFPAGPAAAAPNPDQQAKFVQYFHDLLSKANFPRPDYFSFMDAVQQMASLNIPEDAKYQAALATLKATGLSDTSIFVDSAKQYVGMLEADRDAFVQKADEKSRSETEDIQANITRLESQVEQDKQQIEVLQKRIVESTQSAIEQRGKISERSLHYASTKQNYLAVFDTIVGKIKSDAVKIQTYVH